MLPLKLVRLSALMALSKGCPEIVIGLLDGPVALNHPELATDNIRALPGMNNLCTHPQSAACRHGTAVASVLSARRESSAPAICPGCTLLVRPIFSETAPTGHWLPKASPEELTSAIVDCMTAGAGVLNLSIALVQPSSRSVRHLEEVLDYAVRQGVIVVAAAGNQGAIASTVITRHPGVIPVVAYNLRGRPLGLANVSPAIGKQGLGAPGEGVSSLVPGGTGFQVAGTSIAVPFVTGAIALLWSVFPTARAPDIKHALIPAYPRRRSTLVPPLLDAWGAYQTMLQIHPTQRRSVNEQRKG
jgi:subtilisin family serine protease